MKLPTRLKNTVTKFEQIKSSLTNHNKRKRLTLFKCFRNFKAWNLHIDRRMQFHHTAPDEIDETERKCINCGHHYTGRICPQCGQAGTWSRYTWKQALLNLLDIWGLGNRPMFRTLRELFWRPGYMIRDYLDGHRQFYFPPFKLVAVAVVLLIFVGWLTGIHGFSPLGLLTEITGLNEATDWEGVKSFIESQLASHNYNISSSLLSVLTTLAWFIWFISKNLLYEWLFIGAILVVCIWIAYIRVNRYNFVETYIFLTYVLALFLLCMIPGTLLYWLNKSTVSVSPFLHSCSGVALVLYIITVCFLHILVFRQFFGLTWISTISHLIYTILVGIGLAIGIAGFIYNIMVEDYVSVQQMVYTLIAIVLIVKGFGYAKKTLEQNKETVSKAVINSCKAAMLSLLYIFSIDCDITESAIFNFILTVLCLVLFTVASVYLSLLPVGVYKKYHSTWHALLSLLPVIILVITVNYIF